MSDFTDKEREISRFYLFAGLEPAAIRAIAGLVEERTYAKGTKIFDDHDPSGEVYLLRTGIVSIHLFSITPAYDITISRLYAGDVLGEFALAEDPQRSAAATCMEEVQAYVLRVGPVRAYFDQNPAVGYRVMSNLANIMAGRVKHMNRRLLNLTRASLF
jgi:CRP-like cAMP-binding protein